MNFEEALALAVSMHREGNLGLAEELYRSLLEAVPRHPDVLHFYGVLCHQLGRSDEAIRHIELALVRSPDHVDAWSNLGNVYKETERIEEAALCYRRAVTLRPDFANAWCNLGTIVARGDAEEAESCYRRAISFEPEHADAHHNLGNVLLSTGRTEEAAREYARAIELKPDSGPAYQSLCACLRRAGRIEESNGVLREWLAFDPGNPVALHLLAAASEEVPERASREYVLEQFDRSASFFDDHLALLRYRAPRLVAETLARELSGGRDLAVLDAGCGTGLCAESLRPLARRLVGVDLSPGMLARAKLRGGYDELVEADLVTYLEENPASFDLVVSCDTLNYFGNLGPVFRACRSALLPGGTLVFTVEHAEEGDRGGYALELHGRFSHTERYVREELETAGLETAAVTQDVLRNEVGKPVAGLVVLARRTG